MKKAQGSFGGSITIWELSPPQPKLPLHLCRDRFSLSRSQMDEIVSWGCCNKEPHTCGLKQQKFILSQGWRPDVWNLSPNQEGCTFSGGILGTIHSLPLLAPGHRVVSWLVATSLQSLFLWSHGLFSVANLPHASS